MKLTKNDRKMVAELRKLQKQQRVNRQFGLIMLPIMILSTVFVWHIYADEWVKWNWDISPWVSKTQLSGFIFLMTNMICVVGMIRLIIGNRGEARTNTLLLRLIDDHDDGNSQQEPSPSPADEEA